jgi:hypothetical protein
VSNFDGAAEVPGGTPRSPDAVSTYLNCPRCGLSIELRSQWLAVQHCPRCIARARTAVKLFSSTLPVEALYAKADYDNDD